MTPRYKTFMRIVCYLHFTLNLTAAFLVPSYVDKQQFVALACLCLFITDIYRND